MSEWTPDTPTEPGLYAARYRRGQVTLWRVRTLIGHGLQKHNPYWDHQPEPHASPHYWVDVEGEPETLWCRLPDVELQCLHCIRGGMDRGQCRCHPDGCPVCNGTALVAVPEIVR